MKKNIIVNELIDKVNKYGSILLYMNVDTGKAVIKAD